MEEQARGRGRPRKIPLNDEIAEVNVDTSADIGGGSELNAMPLPEQVNTTPEAGTPEYDAYVASLRQTRKGYGAIAQKLAYAPRTGYKRHWFNDVGGRVQDFQDAGWASVIDPKTGKPVSRTVGTSRDNQPLKAFLLEIPSVFWQEREAEIHALAREKMDAIKGSPAIARPGESKASDSGKFYSPKEEAVQIREGR